MRFFFCCLLAVTVVAFQQQSRRPEVCLRSSRLKTEEPSLVERLLSSTLLATLLVLSPLASHAEPVSWQHTVYVDANGEESESGKAVMEGLLSLPPTTPELTKIKFTVTRPAKALVYKPGGEPKGGVVFLHGFSQQPKNYETTLRALAASGLEVVAPETWVLDTVNPFVNVETTTFFDSPQAKLQTAVIIDGLRSLEFLASENKPMPLSLTGHSMGGACALVIPSLTTKDITSVFAMSPAAEASSTTILNPYLSDDIALYRDLFENYASKPKIALISAKKDLIVSPKSVANVYDQAPNSAILELQQGSHVGFEDSLKIRIPLGNGRTIKLFKALDYLIYGTDALQELFDLDYDLQRDTTKVLMAHLNTALSNADDTANDVTFDRPVKDWDQVSKLTTKTNLFTTIFANPLQQQQKSSS